MVGCNAALSVAAHAFVCCVAPSGWLLTTVEPWRASLLIFLFPMMKLIIVCPAFGLARVEQRRHERAPGTKGGSRDVDPLHTDVTKGGATIHPLL